MIRTVVRLDPKGVLRSVELEGHAEFSISGTDIVCAAVTALVRSAARILELDERFELTGSAEEPGRLAFSVRSIAPEGAEYLNGVSSYLILGLGDLSSEFPEQCSIEVQKGAFHGA